MNSNKPIDYQEQYFFKKPEIPFRVESIEDRVQVRSRYLNAFLGEMDEDLRKSLLAEYIKAGPLKNVAEVIIQHELKQKFTLTPLIGLYKKVEGHLIGNIARELNLPVFVIPTDARIGLTYNFQMAVPANEDMLENARDKGADNLLKDQREIIDGCIREEFDRLLYDLKPMHPVIRMFGIDGFWTVFDVWVIDDPEIFWSPFLVETPYKGTQPFVAVKDGEFSIVQHNPPQEYIIKNVIEKIKERLEARDHAIRFIDPHSIDVDSAWLIEQGISIDENGQLNTPNSKYGRKIPSMTIDEEEINFDYPLEMMDKKIIEKAAFEFSEDAIKKYSIIRDVKFEIKR